MVSRISLLETESLVQLEVGLLGALEQACLLSLDKDRPSSHHPDLKANKGHQGCLE
jgi:hypothetical protein